MNLSAQAITASEMRHEILILIRLRRDAAKTAADKATGTAKTYASGRMDALAALVVELERMQAA